MSSGVSVFTSRGVNLLDVSIESQILLKSVVVLFNGSVGFVPLSNESHEFELLSRKISSGSNSSDSGNSESSHVL